MLVQAFNLLFSANKNPFVIKDIAYKDVLPCNAPKPELKIEAEGQTPFHLWFVRGDKRSGSEPGVNKAEMVKIISGAVANEIARLLNKAVNSEACLGDRVLCASDIAVLVRTHHQARMVHREIIRRGIPCVLHSTGYIYETEEAKQLYIILSALSNPTDETLVRSALATEIIGMTGEKIFELSSDEGSWEKIMVSFKDYHDLWFREGFYSMFRNFMTANDIYVQTRNKTIAGMS